MAQDAVFFDLDGTLTDSKVGITRSIQYAMTKIGRAAPPAHELYSYIGPPLRGTFAALLGSSDQNVLDRAVSFYRERFGTVGLFENELYPSIPEALAAVRALGCRMYVVTSKPVGFAARIVEHFGLSRLFAGVYGSQLDGSQTDKAELIAHALSAENLPASGVVMVGDRWHDMVGARSCHVYPLGVSYGYGTEDELRNHGAAAIADSPGSIPPLVRSRFGGETESE
jgi:phosphoglycolate phosphatase